MASLFNVCDETARVGKRLEKFGRGGLNNPNRFPKRGHVEDQLVEVEDELERATEKYHEALLTAQNKYRKISQDSGKGFHRYCCSKLPPTWTLDSSYSPTSPVLSSSSSSSSNPAAESPVYSFSAPLYASNPAGLSLGYVPDDPSGEVPSFLPEAVPEKTKVVIQID